MTDTQVGSNHQPTTEVITLPLDLTCISHFLYNTLIRCVVTPKRLMITTTGRVLGYQNSQTHFCEVGA